MEKRDLPSCFGYLVLFFVVVALFYGFMNWTLTAITNQNKAKCETIALVSKYPIKFEGNVWGKDQCLAEVNTGVWVDVYSIKDENVH